MLLGLMSDNDASVRAQREPSPTPVVEEERLLDVVLAAARRPQTPAFQRDDYDSELLRLRDELVEVRLPEDKASILEQMDRIARLASQRQKQLRVRLDVGAPYFGHMRLVDEDEENRRDILIGKQTFVRDGVRIVDWRNAPISRVFYQRNEGDDFSLLIAGRMMEGEVVLRRTVTIQDAELLRVSGPQGTWVKTGRDWVEVGSAAPMLAGGAGTAARPEKLQPVLGVGTGAVRLGHVGRVDKHLPEIASLLDAEQFDLITRPDSGLVAIQGSAGSGKTTVALHRVAYLAFLDRQRFNPARSLVVVFSRALAAYISKVLPALGVEGVPVATYEDWARSMRSRVARKLPDRYSDETPGVVTRLKLHSALLPMLERGVADNPNMSTVELFDELFTSRGWLGQGVDEHAPGAFSETELDAVHRWCTDQFYVRDDGGGLREHDVPCLDREDDTILIRLHQLRHGGLPAGRGRKLAYRHLVVDEAQDLSPLELSVLLATVAPDAPITLAGDTAQKVIEDNDFQEWQQVLSALDQQHVQVSPLSVSYRSTAQIMRVAREVLGPLAPDEPLLAAREGHVPQLLRFPGRGEAATYLGDALKRLMEAEPTASVAVLTRYEHQADAIYGSLERVAISRLRRVKDHDFRFEAGIDVTDIRQAKGLEFDYVVLMDTDTVTYPVSDTSRHMLHVGITRAAHQVWLVAVGPPSRVLPSWLTPSHL